MGVLAIVALRSSRETSLEVTSGSLVLTTRSLYSRTVSASHRVLSISEGIEMCEKNFMKSGLNSWGLSQSITNESKKLVRPSPVSHDSQWFACAS